MPVPDYQSLMLPVLKVAAEKPEIDVAECRDRVAMTVNLTPDDLGELLPSGTKLAFNDRMAWSKTYMESAGLIETIRRGVFRVTKRGHELLAEKPAKIDLALLRRYPEFVAWQDASRTNVSSKPTPLKSEVSSAQTPEERMASAHAELCVGLPAKKGSTDGKS